VQKYWSRNSVRLVVLVLRLKGLQASPPHDWLFYKVPFLNGKLPAPDDPLYVSIDQDSGQNVHAVYRWVDRIDITSP
jgi:hypothetical protein